MPSQMYNFSLNSINIYMLEFSINVPHAEDSASPVEALVLARYLSLTPIFLTIAISISTLELYCLLCLHKPSFSVEAYTKVICDLYKVSPSQWLRYYLKTGQWPYRWRYHTAIANAFDVYLTIKRMVNDRIAAALDRDTPDWRVKNACPPCRYKVKVEIPSNT